MCRTALRAAADARLISLPAKWSNLSGRASFAIVDPAPLRSTRSYQARQHRRSPGASSKSTATSGTSSARCASLMDHSGMKDLRDKKCLITGAASGIGRATAIAAGREGAELFLTDINAAQL